MIALELLRETPFDFSGMPASADQTVTLVRGINVVPYCAGTLVVRWHTGSLTGTQLINPKIAWEAPTPDDPAIEFMGTDIGGVSILSTDTAPSVFYQELTAPFPASVRLCMRMRQHSVAGTTFAVKLSATLVLRCRAQSK